MVGTPFVVRQDGAVFLDYNGGGYVQDYELMQFTGLLDMNGKEIYEGDIFEAEEPTFESGVYKYVIRWIDSAAGFLCEQIGEQPKTMEPLFAFNQTEFEIIGNIYKNPELLK